MYKINHNRQYTLDDFDQPMRLTMNPDNRWVKKAATIPWDEIEVRYAELFPSTTGMPAKPLRAALGFLLIQKQLAILTERRLIRLQRTRITNTSSGFAGTRGAPVLPRLGWLNFKRDWMMISSRRSMR